MLVGFHVKSFIEILGKIFGGCPSTIRQSEHSGIMAAVWAKCYFETLDPLPLGSRYQASLKAGL